LGAELDRKIADGKPPFDREVANGAAGIFHGVTSPARGADVTDQREDEILGGHAEWQPALEHHAHCFWPALDDGLCCQHMRQLARPDTEGQRAQPAMRAGVAVAADDQATGKAEAKLGSDDMDNALPGLVDIEHLDASGRRLGPQAREQFLSYLARAGPTARRRDGVSGVAKVSSGLWTARLRLLKIQEAARTAEIVQQMTIDMEEIGIITDMRDDVLVPDFGQQRTPDFSNGCPPFWPLWPAASAATAALHGLLFQASASLYQSTAGRWSARA